MSNVDNAQSAISNEDLQSYGRRANEDGYLLIEGSRLVGHGDISDLKAFQESYFRLPPDADGGQRYRAYSAFNLSENKLTELAVQGYMQSKAYNEADGDKLRTFQPIEPAIRRSNFIRQIIEKDAAIVKATGIVSFDGAVKLGLHQVRYQPANAIPSYSSPPWLHKDDEPAVFVHLVNLSANLTGGDSVLAVSGREFQRVLKLLHPFDTLFLTHKLFHAVTPVGIDAGAVGFRDILIVTFEAAAQAKIAA